MGSDGGPCCACLSVAYDPERLEGGLCRDRWVCQTCGVEFTRKPFFATLEAERDAALARVRPPSREAVGGEPLTLDEAEALRRERDFRNKVAENAKLVCNSCGTGTRSLSKLGTPCKNYGCEGIRVELIRGDVTMPTLRDLIDERDAALERVRELTEWRPMETAPRDGTAILLIESFGERGVIARWVRATWASVCAYSGTFYTNDDDDYNGWLPLPPTP